MSRRRLVASLFAAALVLVCAGVLVVRTLPLATGPLERPTPPFARAMFAGVADGYRFSMMFNTYTVSEHARYSPGLILIRNIIDHYAPLGYRALDLGIGTDEYKRLFCKSEEPLFDSFLPLNVRGQFAAATLSASSRGMRRVKQNQILLRLTQAVRGILH